MSYSRNYYQTHRAQFQSYRGEQRTNQNRLERDYRDLIMRAYGSICACCGEKNLKFLSIDHVNNDGYKDKSKRRIDLFRKIIGQGFPPRYRILCFNCNLGREHNGGICPHVRILSNRWRPAPRKHGQQDEPTPLPLLELMR